MMAEIDLSKYISAKKKSGKPIKMVVNGISMFPVLNDAEVITVVCNKKYKTGDVLVYFYDKMGILAHRCLIIDGTDFFCKGDNSYKIEKIKGDQIIGKVQNVLRNNDEIPLRSPDENFIRMSIEINRLYIENDFDIIKTNESELYKRYSKIYLQGERQ